MYARVSKQWGGEIRNRCSGGSIADLYFGVCRNRCDIMGGIGSHYDSRRYCGCCSVRLIDVRKLLRSILSHLCSYSEADIVVVFKMMLGEETVSAVFALIKLLVVPKTT